MSEPVVIHWFRRDLRLHDNTAFNAALDSGSRVLPVFVLDPALLRGERFSPRRLSFMLDGLSKLDGSLREHGGELTVLEGRPEDVLPRLAAQVDAQALYFNLDYTPYAVERDERVRKAMFLEMRGFHDLLVHEPGAVLKADGGHFTVYTPFRRVWDALPKAVPHTRSPAGRLAAPKQAMRTDIRERLQRASVPIAAGEQEAVRRLHTFAENTLPYYGQTRDRLVANPFDSTTAMFGETIGTSYLSPYIRFGMVSPRQLIEAAERVRGATRSKTVSESVRTWIGELAWRDFYAHILHFHPKSLNTSFRPEYERVSFRSSQGDLDRWKAGMTGYPVVDAAMRQLNAIGWMHNRARMIVASFLTKDLLIYWREGDIGFMQQLMDGDLPANTGGWQWAAGTGTDAQPYFRIFNPVSQSRRFDPDGDYIRYWVPELRDLSNREIHAPWETEKRPEGYPSPIVDHAAARVRTLSAFQKVRAS
jgi:deoxyribodipyrimidine photo-lyase